MKMVPVNHYVQHLQLLLNFHLVRWESFILEVFIVAFFFIEPPGGPGQPEITELTNNSVTLNWDKPSSDGGNSFTKDFI
jgi:hypothetical protein